MGIERTADIAASLTVTLVDVGLRILVWYIVYRLAKKLVTYTLDHYFFLKKTNKED